MDHLTEFALNEAGIINSGTITCPGTLSELSRKQAGKTYTYRSSVKQKLRGKAGRISVKFKC